MSTQLQLATDLPAQLPEDVKAATNAYLLAYTFAEITREAVDKIQREILAELQFMTKPHHRSKDHPHVCLDPKETYHLSDSDFQVYLDESHKRTREAGIKPADMERDYCPALVAESLLRDATHALINAVGKMIGWPNALDSLLCHIADGKYDQFIELSVKMVLVHPDYIPPTL
jgi:hypothetical protein